VRVVKTNRTLLFLGFLLLTLLTPGKAAEDPKTPLLERVITINLEQETIASALKKIGEQAGFTFSYNSDILASNKLVSYNAVNKPVREILDHIFKGSIQYKERRKHIILTKAKDTSKDTRKLSGYIIDEATGERLKNVSIYDPISLSSAVTDAYGFFQIEIEKPSNEEISLTVQKLNYSDTVVMVRGDGRGLLKVPIRIDK
jgi:hypothetical protein